MKVKLHKAREQTHLQREKDSPNCRALLEAEMRALSKRCGSSASTARGAGEAAAKPGCPALTGGRAVPGQNALPPPHRRSRGCLG